MTENAFILSAGRSGSTLLSNLLNGHSEILSTPESVFLVLLGIKYGNQSSFSEKDYQIIAEHIWLRKKELKGSWNQDKTQLLEQLISQQPQSITNILDLIYRSYNGVGKKINPKVIIDKNPMYSRYLKVIDRCYPKAKKIILVRDYRDRFVSIRKNQPFKFVSPGIIRGIAWARRNKVLHKYYCQNKASCLLVKYESLINNTDLVLTEICQFVGLEFEEEMKDFRLQYKHQFESEEVSEVQQKFLDNMHHLSSQPITNSRIGIWKELDKKTIQKLEVFCSKIGSEFGYEPSQSISLFNKSVVRIKLMPKITKGIIVAAFRKVSFYLPFWLQKILVNYLR
ncbi:sulfotransferase [Flavobacteriales bacterium]|nr:sulfotransferase [Flavobacteriales bacterium]MDC3336726.1 sulfotransferase [Flavobacteriales bacterium]